MMQTKSNGISSPVYCHPLPPSVCQGPRKIFFKRACFPPVFSWVTRSVPSVPPNGMDAGMMAVSMALGILALAVCEGNRDAGIDTVMMGDGGMEWIWCGHWSSVARANPAKWIWHGWIDPCPLGSSGTYWAGSGSRKCFAYGLIGRMGAWDRTRDMDYGFGAWIMDNAEQGFD